MHMPRPARTLVRWVTRLHIFVFRLTGGRLGGRFLGVPTLLLTTRGRKTGRQFTTPLYYLEENGVPYVVASFGGSDVEPSWWTNMKATPFARVEVPGRRFDATPRQVDADEKARLWPKLVAMYKPYATYQARCSRDIPVIALIPIEGPKTPSA